MDERVKTVSRLQWGAESPRHREALTGPARRVIIHHTAMEYCEDLTHCINQLNKIQIMHMKERHFDDIGYNFLVGGNGTVYEGRGWGVKGAHTKNHNYDSLGVALMGNFNNDMPSAEAMSSIKQLLHFGASHGYLYPSFALLGHRDLGNTQCPGENLYASLSQLKAHMPKSTAHSF